MKKSETSGKDHSGSATATRRSRPGAIEKQTESKGKLERKGSSDHVAGQREKTRGVAREKR